MKKIIVAVAFFSLMACSKKDNNSIGNDALPKAIFQNGKKVEELFYDNAGRIVKINFYNDEGADTLQNILENTYDARGLLIKEGFRKPDSSFLYEYNEHGYNTKGELINSKPYSLSEEQRTNGKKDKIYTTASFWVRTKVEYDSKGRITRIEGESTYSGIITKNAQAYIYDNNDNILTNEVYSQDRSGTGFELFSTETYEYDLHIPVPKLFSLSENFPFNQCKNFRTKTTRKSAYEPGKQETTTSTITKKDSKGNIIEIKETHIKSNGETKETIISLRY